MQLEVGKQYRTRLGEIVGPMLPNPDTPDFPFRFSVWTWTADGGYFESRNESIMDIVEEVSPPPEEGPAEVEELSEVLTYVDGLGQWHTRWIPSGLVPTMTKTGRQFVTGRTVRVPQS